MAFTADELQALNDILEQKLSAHRGEMEQAVDRALAAQLLAIEELLNQKLMLQPGDTSAAVSTERSPEFEAFEVQTELPWEDLADIFGKLLDERFTALNTSMQAVMKEWEQLLSDRLRNVQSQLHDELARSRQQPVETGNLASMQEVFRSIEQLERLIESMQVSVTSNLALLSNRLYHLSNRLYHHRQLSLEQAHPAATEASHPDGAID